MDNNNLLYDFYAGIKNNDKYKIMKSLNDASFINKENNLYYLKIESEIKKGLIYSIENNCNIDIINFLITMLQNSGQNLNFVDDESGHTPLIKSIILVILMYLIL